MGMLPSKQRGFRRHRFCHARLGNRNFGPGGMTPWVGVNRPCATQVVLAKSASEASDHPEQPGEDRWNKERVCSCTAKVSGARRWSGIRAERFGGTVVAARNSVPPGNASRAAVFSTTRAVPTLCLVACAHRVPGSEEIAPREPSAHARTLTVFVPSVIFLRDDAAGVCVCVRRRQPQTNRWTRERQ